MTNRLPPAKRFTTVMKLRMHFSLLAVPALLLLTASGASAFGGKPGGPFGNGSYFSNEGTFTAVVRGENLTGTMQFSTTAGAGPDASASSTTDTVEFAGLEAASTTSTSSTGGVGSTGISNIFFEGRTYSGNTQGTYNPEDNSMAVSFQAQSQGQGEITYTLPSDLPDIETTTKVYDSGYVSGFVDCKTSNAFPNQKFKGTGEATARSVNYNDGNSDPTLNSETIQLEVSGVRLSDTATSFNTTPVRPPSVFIFTGTEAAAPVAP